MDGQEQRLDEAVKVEAQQKPNGGRQPQLNWDDRKMTTSFANVVNIQSTREQVDLFFGANQTWNMTNDTPLTIELSNRIILSPFAAKRLLTALSGVMREYDARHGAINF